MRAMVHLGLLGFVAGCLIERQVSSETVSGGQGWSNSLRRLANRPLCRTRAGFRLAISPAESSQIASRASQIAAALLFDLGTVDIRRVGTQSKRILAAGCSEYKSGHCTRSR